jgi:hypothetical protein
MNVKHRLRFVSDVRDPAARESVEALDRAIDEAIRWQIMRQDPPAQAYARVIDAIREPESAPAADAAGFRSWVIAFASAAAAALLVTVGLGGAGIASVDVSSAAPGRAGLFLLWLSSTSLATWINESESVVGYSGILFCHTFGLAMVVGLSAAVDLRLLGAARRVALTDLRPLFRFIWIGFWLNAVSGALLFAANAPGRATNLLFEFKLALVALGVVVMALIERRLRQYEGGSGRFETATGGLRLLALASLALWLAAIAAGRLLAYAL